MRAVERLNGKFGTWRGFVRLALSYFQIVTIPKADLTKVERLVFVCHGNICRSAYADVLARDLGMRAASFGLSTTTGLPAHPPIADAARDRGVDPSGHLTTNVEDFSPQDNDLLLAMEVRQVARLRRDPRFARLQIDLLGRYAAVPHIHDPYQLNEDYVRTSLARIDRAVRTLVSRVRAAKAS
ncbi:MAG: phosphotyrosine protein phosphatase [Sphingomonadales bacterium]|nr:phosphotyrosine protein phosphatase [Sphingomonadales bacterium]